MISSDNAYYAAKKLSCHGTPSSNGKIEIPLFYWITKRYRVERSKSEFSELVQTLSLSVSQLSDRVNSELNNEL
jgi:hypothetical protein